LSFRGLLGKSRTSKLRNPTSIKTKIKRRRRNWIN